MAIKTTELKAENLRMKEEIEVLQQALQDLYLEKYKGRPRSLKRNSQWPLEQPYRSTLIADIANKLDKGVFSPPRTSSSRGRNESFTGLNTRSRSGSNKEIGKRGKLAGYVARGIEEIEASVSALGAVEPQLGRSLQKDLGQLKHSAGLISQPLDVEKLLLDEIKALKRENKQLRRHIRSQKSPNQHNLKSQQRSSSRLRHCRTCDGLLSFGFPTTHCSTHGHH